MEGLFLLFALLLPFSVRTHKPHSTPFGVEDKLAAQFTYVFVSAPTHYKGKGGKLPRMAPNNPEIEKKKGGPSRTLLRDSGPVGFFAEKPTYIALEKEENAI